MRTRKGKPKDEPIGFVRCPECGYEQADMGRGVTCDDCGYGPMPTRPPTVAGGASK